MESASPPFIRKIDDLVNYNQVLKNIAIKQELGFIPLKGFPTNGLSADNLHPNKIGHDFIAEKVELYISSLD